MTKDKRRAPQKQTWAARFSPEICHMWSLLQFELREKGGVSADARRLEAQIRSALNIRPGSPLPAERLHQATFPTRSRRPEMVDLPGPSSARPTAAQTLSQVVEQPQPAPAPSRAVLTDAALVEMHREAQAALVHGVTPYAMRCQIDLEREICRALDLDIITERDTVEYLLDRLHDMAGISAPRLVVYNEVPPSPLE